MLFLQQSRLEYQTNKKIALNMLFFYSPKWENKTPIFTSPHKPTMAYIIVTIEDSGVNNDSTKLKSKKPINPQFNAPIIVKINATFWNVSIYHPFSNYYVHKNTIYSWIFLTEKNIVKIVKDSEYEKNIFNSIIYIVN